MGQYHRLVNLDKREWVDPYGLGLGGKQYEHTGGLDGSLSDAMYLLCMTSPAQGNGDFPVTTISGRWVGDRVVIVGDYTNDLAIRDFEGSESLYQIAEAQYLDITHWVRGAFESVFNITYSEENVGTHVFWRRELI